MRLPEPQVKDEGVIRAAPLPESRLASGFSLLISGRRRRIIEGLVLGTLTGLCASQLGLNALLPIKITQDFLALPALIGFLLALSPARLLLRGTACILMAALFIISYTPLIAWIAPSLERSDPLEREPAVVVLSTSLRKDNTLDASGQERVLHGYLLVRQGYSDRLVLTRSVPGIGDETPIVLAQMRMLGFSFPVNVVGPVANTHDEAVAVAKLARERGWKRVILVTQPWHMRRARAVFLKAGVDVLCSPCAEGSYAWKRITTPSDRLFAFRDWLHETTGIAVYRLRGWL